jgi:hypothetical protein
MKKYTMANMNKTKNTPKKEYFYVISHQSKADLQVMLANVVSDTDFFALTNEEQEKQMTEAMRASNPTYTFPEGAFTLVECFGPTDADITFNKLKNKLTVGMN